MPHNREEEEQKTHLFKIRIFSREWQHWVQSLMWEGVREREAACDSTKADFVPWKKNP